MSKFITHVLSKKTHALQFSKKSSQKKSICILSSNVIFLKRQIHLLECFWNLIYRVQREDMEIRLQNAEVVEWAVPQHSAGDGFSF